jgi:ABC-type proline/glycine betaine transport system ATPase subunit
VLVTHDVEEAWLLADRIVLLERGRVAQQGTPRELVQHPESAFVRGFLGPRGQTGPAPETFLSDALPPGAPPACAPAPRPASLADLLG